VPNKPKSRFTQTQILYGVVAAAVVVLLVATYLVVWGGSGEGPLPTGAAFTIKVQPRDRTMGSPNAPIQFVEYAAPSCPHCAHWNEAVFPKFKAQYIDTGKVYYIFRVFPLSPIDAAVEAMARCLPKESYFQFIDMMFRNQDRWDPDGHDIPDVHAALVNMGRIAGMSEDRVNACISNQDKLNEISDVGDQAHKRFGINSTPSFIVNGILTRKPFVWEGLKETLADAMKKKAAETKKK